VRSREYSLCCKSMEECRCGENASMGTAEQHLPPEVAEYWTQDGKKRATILLLVNPKTLVGV